MLVSDLRAISDMYIQYSGGESERVWIRGVLREY
jgi:hypothetical protein